MGADPTRWLRQPATKELHQTYAHRAVEMFQRVVGAETLENYLRSLGGSVEELRRQLADASRSGTAGSIPRERDCGQGRPDLC